MEVCFFFRREDLRIAALFNSKMREGDMFGLACGMGISTSESSSLLSSSSEECFSFRREDAEEDAVACTGGMGVWEGVERSITRGWVVLLLLPAVVLCVCIVEE